jgi:hypothetical protein
MTKEETNKQSNSDTILENYHKLSIQVSLNGLSFCVLDTIGQTISRSDQLIFDKELTPFEVLKELKSFLKKHAVQDFSFSDVVVVHRNSIFSLVPQSLFDEKELANYLKFNAKLLANDLIEYDEIPAFELVNVYVPFVNINNYIYDLFGEFVFKHHATVLVESLMGSQNIHKEPVCYIYCTDTEMDITIVDHKKLLYYNHFFYSTKEDFLYYLLFTLEQLKLDPNTIKLRLFGKVEEGSPVYVACHEYIQNVSIYIPAFPEYMTEDIMPDSTNYIAINAF